MSEQADYFDKYLTEKFNHIDESIKDIHDEVKKIDEKVEKVITDNKATRRWIFGTVVGTGLTVLLGLAAILFTFVQIQNSWMQQVFSFVGKAIMK
jgi:hypothetical protein